MAGYSIRITTLHVNAGGRWCRQQYGGFENTTRYRGCQISLALTPPLPLRQARGQFGSPRLSQRAYHYPERSCWQKMCYDGARGPAVGCARLILHRRVIHGW
jgi:hypothetical protein